MWPNLSILFAEYRETPEQKQARELRNAEIWLAECEGMLKGAQLRVAAARARK